VLTTPAVVAWRRTFRAIALRPVIGVAVFCVVPTAWTLLRHGHDLRYAWVAAVVVGGAGLAFAVDDDAAVLLAASPSPLFIRRAARVFAAAVPVVAAWLVIIELSAATNRLDGAPVGLLGVEALTAAGVALAVAGTGRRAGNVGTGVSGFFAGILTMAFVSAMSVQYPWLPRVGEAAHHERWLWIAAAAWAAALWSARDESR